MLGAIMGDIVGSRYEFNNIKTTEFELFSKACFVTDDTIMTLAISEALRQTVKQVNRHAKTFYHHLERSTITAMQTLGRRYPNAGYGNRFKEWIYNDNPKPYYSFGNGAAMRISTIAWFAQNEEECKACTHAVTHVTHNHPEGLKGAEATAIAIFMARNGHSKENIKTRIEKDYYPLDFTLDAIRPFYAFNETCQDTVPQAMQAFFESSSFEEAIRLAISLGGDSDTLAAITGSIAEAYYGIPKPFKTATLSYLDPTLRHLYDAWVKMISKDNN